MQHVVGQDPHHFGHARSRWWLDGLRQTIAWLQPLSLVGVHRLLWRLDIHYKRGRRYVHSPDPAYAAKLTTVASVRERAHADPRRIVTLYQDELTYYRRPSVAHGYARSGVDAPRADQGHDKPRKRRVSACLDALSGALFSWQRSRFNVATLLRYYGAVEAAYPAAERIYVVQDNWPVHFLPHVLAALEPSTIRLVRLPTYAPWTNPVEKVWRLLYQQVLHLHPWVQQWDALQDAVQTWLDQWAAPSIELLHLVGLLRD